MDKNYKVIKLRTGETIMCRINGNPSPRSESFLTIEEPALLVPAQDPRSEYYVIRPWMSLSDSEEFTIASDMILTIGSLNKMMRNQYIKYLERSEEERFEAYTQEAVSALLQSVTPDKAVFEIDDEEVYGTNLYMEIDIDKFFNE